MKVIHILYVDDSPFDRELVLDSLEKERGDFRVTQAASRADFETALAAGNFDLVLSDFNILGFEGLQVLETVHAKDPNLPVIIVTGTGSEEIAVEAMKHGAADYIIKTPRHIQRLPLTIHSVLERKSLKEDRDRLFNLSLDLLCVAGFDGYFKQLNPAWEKTLGWSNQELLSKPYTDFVHPDDREATSQISETLVDGQLVYFFENRYLCKDGSTKWISWNSYPLVDESLIFAVARDITERKQAEDALLESERRFRKLADNSPDVIYVMDLVKHRLLFFNHQEFCGYSRQELVSSNSILGAVHPDDLSVVSARWQSLIKGEAAGTRVIEYRLRRKEGGWEWVQSRETILTRGQNNQPTQLLVTLTIITERKQAEEALRQAEQKYRTIFENAMEGIHQTTRDGKYISANPAAARILGYDSPEELMSSINDLNTQFYVEPGRREEFLKRIEAQEAVSDFESEVYRKDGSRVWVSENVHAVRDGHGALLYYEGTSQDITERKRAEDSLLESEKRYHDIFNGVQEAIFVETLDGRILAVNEQACVMYGYSRAEFLTKTVADLVPEKHPIFLAADPDYVLTMTPVETVNRRANGEVFPIEISGRLQTINGEKVLLVVARDITERKQAEEKIQQQIERLSALREIDQTITSNVNLNHSLTTLISRTVTLLNVDAATVLLLQSETHTLSYGAGSGFRTTAPETASVKFGESYAGLAALEKRLVQIPNLAEEPDNFFLTGFLKGEDFVSYHGAPLIVKGEVVGVLEVFNRAPIERDQDWLDFFITLAGQAAIAIANAQLFLKLHSELQERLRTEEEIRELNLKLEQRVAERTVELERALRVKDEFLANMSHELRTPLNAILGMSESLEEGIGGDLSEKQTKYIRTINESGHHLLNLINDILDLAKIEAGQASLDITKVDIRSICQASLRMIQQLARKKNQGVSFMMDDDVNLVWADQRRLKQMIVNLLSNAVKFTPDGGELGLEVTANREENHISITVWDHGVGISEKDLERLFQPFVQVDSALSRNSSGTGLGLALVAQMARLHGGQVRVKSTPGQGSRFTIVLPWNPANRTGSLVPTKPDASSSNTPMPATPSHTILLVEDTAGAAMMMEDYLMAAGFNVIVAVNGLEAISQAETIQPDLILMDVMMPEMDGFEATRIIRKNQTLRKTPILGLTALAMSGDRERCMEAGMNDHISKPVKLMDLLRTIRTYLPPKD